MFAVKGEAQLAYLLPGVQDAIAKLRADARAIGIETVVGDYGGARTQDIVTRLIQWRDEAVAAGEDWYRVSPWGKTKHAFGGAADLYVTKRPANMTEAQAYAALGKLAPRRGLVWGGTFTPKPDIWHFESQQSLSQLETRWNEWTKDPKFPKGFADPFVLLALVVLALVIFLLTR